jgi:hypothetical protein
MCFEKQLPKPLSGDYYASQDYAPFECIVDRVLSEGLILLSADPKIGKTRFSMQLCEAVTTGGMLFDTFQAKPGHCLCFLFESSARAIHSYLNDYEMDNSKISFLDREHLFDIDIDNGFAEIVEKHLEEFPDTQLIIVDMYDDAKGDADKKRQYDYCIDRKNLNKFRDVIGNRIITLLLVHHNRKEWSDNPTQMVAGTQGLTSATDGNLVFQYNPKTKIIKLTYSFRNFNSGEVDLKSKEDDIHFEIAGDNSELLRKDTPLTLSIKKLITNRNSWSGSATELQKLLGGDCSEISINALGKELRKSAEDLFQMHRITLTTKKKSTKLPDGAYKSGRLITLKKA